MPHPRPTALATLALSASLTLILSACVTPAETGDAVSDIPAAARNLDDLVLVDCRLPGQIRQLGSRMTYLGPRRAIKTTRSDCGIRGGEFVLFDRSDYATALATLLPQAESGDAVAQTYVGEIYEKGLGLPAPDPARAAYWYRKAAESGHRPAQTNLGSLYERGLGVTQDRAAALDWYRRGVGLDQDRLVFESTLDTERRAFQRELALRNQVTASLRQQLRQATASRPAPAPAPGRPAPTRQAAAPAPVPAPVPAPTVPASAVPPPELPPVAAPPVASAQQLRKVAQSQRLEVDSEAERLRRELHAIETLKASAASAGPEQTAPAHKAQLGKLELTRNEQYTAMLDTSRRLSFVQP